MRINWERESNVRKADPLCIDSKFTWLEGKDSESWPVDAYCCWWMRAEWAGDIDAGAYFIINIYFISFFGKFSFASN